MNDFRNRDFFHEGMREFQDLLTGAEQLKPLKQTESTMSFGMMKKN